ncbi:MAG TPA: anti-sigma factor [Ktedonobacteraceae bacterium]|nr:anti-sigma factor [Ktedonobacteraceae bacterium]
MNCKEFEDLSGAYVLDAVTPIERQAAEEHLATCDGCAKLVRELSNVAELLPLAAPQIDPPEQLKRRVMSAIAQESERSFQPVSLASRRRQPRWGMRLLAVAAVLATVLLGGMAVWNVDLQGQVAMLQRQVATVTSANSMSYTVKGTQYAPGASGQLVYIPQQHLTVLIVRSLPQLRGVQVYQGWLLQLKNGKPIGVTSLGLLNFENGVATLSYAGDLSGYNAAAVSLESGPKATLNAPKGNVFAQVLLQQPGYPQGMSLLSMQGRDIPLRVSWYLSSLLAC